MGKKIFLCFCLILLVGIDKSFCKELKRKEKVKIYELKKGNFSVQLTNWGATLMSLVLPDKNGKLDDIVLGFDKAQDYKNDSVYFGSIVGRVANRIGKAQFKLNGVHYKLVANEGDNMLHGGKKGFSDVTWRVKHYHNRGEYPRIKFTYNSFDGEQGFPGNLKVTVSYTLHGHSKLHVLMTAKALNKDTPVNLAQHTYWNLGGDKSGNILSEQLQLFASRYTPVDAELIPTGELLHVKGTPYDFREPHVIGSRIDKLPYGYDINYALDGPTKTTRKVAVVLDKESGRKMEVFTNQPGLQLYTSNGLRNVKGKGGYVYEEHDGLCLETQGYPDAVNHPEFPSQIVKKGRTYVHKMVYKFSVFS